MRLRRICSNIALDTLVPALVCDLQQESTPSGMVTVFGLGIVSIRVTSYLNPDGCEPLFKVFFVGQDY